jgi:hypothetical protein
MALDCGHGSGSVGAVGPPAEERLRLGEELWASVAPADLWPLVAEFIERADRTNRALDVTIRRLDDLDELLARDRAEARESARRAAEEWLSPLSSKVQ